MTSESTLAVKREEQFRRTALLYFLPLVILNFLAGARVMSSNPGLVPNEHYIGFICAGLLTVAALVLVQDIRRLMPVSYFLCGVLGTFFVYRQTSLMFGPSALNERLSVFMPLYGYYAIFYFAFLVFLPRRIAERACWGFWVIFSLIALLRLLPDWDYFAGRHGARDLLIYLLIANPMFILLARLMMRMQALLTVSEAELESSQRELELMGQVASREARFERAVRGSRDGLWEWDPAEKKLWLSGQVSHLLKLTADELPADMDGFLARVQHPERNAVQRAIEQSYREESSFELECSLLCGDGTCQWFALKGVAEHDSSTGGICMSGSLQSIHQRRVAEDALRASNEALSEFAAVAAHDMKAPVRRISMFASRLERELESNPEKCRVHLQGIHRVTENMTELVDRLLDYAAADRPTEAGIVSLHLVLQDVLEILEFEIKEKSAQVSLSNLPKVWGNAGDLRQIFQNLVGNALKFCERAPQIEVVATESGEFVEVAVRDNGIGIKPEYMEQIRMPLERLHSAAEFQGYGLGLATVERILSRNGGSLTIDSTPGEGSVFTVRLPAGDSPSDSDSA